MAEELKLDRHYHNKKLRLVLRDLSGMPADEYARALIRLANVADESVMLEPEFTRAQLPSQGGEAVEVVGYLLTKGNQLSRMPAGSSDLPLMAVAQHQRIMAASVGSAEPVAWINRYTLAESVTSKFGSYYLSPTRNDEDDTPLYTHPADPGAVAVRRELLDSAVSLLAYHFEGSDSLEELRALLANSEGGNRS